MSKQEFWQDDDRYVALTGDCTKGFGKVVFVAFMGANPEAVSETCVHLNQLQKMKRIEVSDVPDEWSDAFTAAGFKMPEPEPEPAVINEEELINHVALGLDPVTAVVASTHVESNEQPDSQGSIIFWFLVLFGFWFCVIVGLSFKDWAGL